MEQLLYDKLKYLCLTGVENRVFPGVAAAVSLGKREERIRCIQVAGTTRTDNRGCRVDRRTVFDLASLTKPLATSLLFFILIEKGVIDLQERLGSLFELKKGQDKRNINIGMLLTHSSGLSSYRPYFKEFKAEIEPGSKERIMKRIMADPLEYTPGTECRYSDLGFILLGEIIRRKYGRSLDACFRARVAEPLGLEDDLFFLPVTGCHPKMKKKRTFAATEKCNWRKRLLTAEVHDEHSWLMNGVSGHAGLFGTIGGVLALCEYILDSWQGRGEGVLFSKDIVRRMLRRKYRDRTWCHGFDTPSRQGSSSGSLLSVRSVGHLGYTGTSFWMDPEKDLVMVLLTNRVHPSRENVKIKTFRPFFHDNLVRQILD